MNVILIVRFKWTWIGTLKPDIPRPILCRLRTSNSAVLNVILINQCLQLLVTYTGSCNLLAVCSWHCSDEQYFPK